ncbi:hypothetical protein MRX96_021166 [Rhipicephalus microplus]
MVWRSWFRPTTSDCRLDRQSHRHNVPTKTRHAKSLTRRSPRQTCRASNLHVKALLSDISSCTRPLWGATIAGPPIGDIV